jgi:hypothetical protein
MSKPRDRNQLGTPAQPQTGGKLVNFSPAPADGAGASSPVVEKLWPLIAFGVIAGWGALSYFLFTSFGWVGRGIAISAVVMIAGMAWLFIRTGARSSSAYRAEPQEFPQSKAA